MLSERRRWYRVWGCRGSREPSFGQHSVPRGGPNNIEIRVAHKGGGGMVVSVSSRVLRKIKSFGFFKATPKGRSQLNFNSSATAVSPNDWVRLTQAHRSKGDLNAAEAVIEEGLLAHPGKLKLLREYAEIATAKKNWQEAQRRWGLVVNSTARVDDCVRLIQAHRYKGDLDAAEALSEEGLLAHPGKVKLLIESAEIAIARKNWEQAINRWQGAIDRCSGLAPSRCYVQLSRAYREIGDHQTAIGVAKTAMALFAKNQRKIRLELIQSAFCIDNIELLSDQMQHFLGEAVGSRLGLFNSSHHNESQYKNRLAQAYAQIASYWETHLRSSSEIERLTGVHRDFDCSILGRLKRANTIFILGSGGSINDITNDMWSHMRKNNSVGFNNWYAHDFIPDFFCFEVKRDARFCKRFFSNFNKVQYRYCNIPIIWKDPWAFNPNILAEYRDLFFGKKVIFPRFIELEGGSSTELSDNLQSSLYIREKYFVPEDYIILQRRASLSALVDLACQLGFKNIVLCGVDLVDSKYFWETQDYVNLHDFDLPITPPGGIHKTNDRSFGELTISHVLVEYRNIIKSKYRAEIFLGNKRSALYPEFPLYNWDDN